MEKVEGAEYEDADKVVINGVTYRRLDFIVEEHGMTIQQFRQLRLRGIRLPSAEKSRKNTRGRGAEYLYDETKVLGVIRFVKKVGGDAPQEKSEPDMKDKIVETYRSLGCSKKSVVKATLGITGEGSDYVLFNKLHHELENSQVIRRVGFEGEYELVQVENAT